MRATSTRLRHRSGLQLARLHRRTKAQVRAEVIDALLFPVAIALAIALWKGFDILFGR